MEEALCLKNPFAKDVETRLMTVHANARTAERQFFANAVLEETLQQVDSIQLKMKLNLTRRLYDKR